MAEEHLPDHCLCMPIDHRLRSLLRPDPPTANPEPRHGNHVSVLEQYGRDLQNGGENISLREIRFAKTLAMPKAKGGVLILLQQPAPNQQYDGRDFNTIIQECETLRAVENVLRTVIGSSLEETSCFDAFPFQKIPIPGKSKTGYLEYDEAYNVCKEMIQQKQPDVVLCCYQSPDITKFNLLYSLGVGKTRGYKLKLGDRFCTPVNAFHPSYAVNYNKSESCFRTLYMLETLKAFHEINGTWSESEWMDQLRSFCMGRAKDLVREKEKAPQLQNSERWERSFRDGLTGLKSYLHFMCSEDTATLSERGLYNRVVRDNISRLACDCLLVMSFVVEASEAGNPSLRRDARSLTRPIRKLTFEFLEDVLKGPLKTIKKEVGFVESSAIEKLSLSLKISRAEVGLDYGLKTNLQKMMRNLSNSFIYEGNKNYLIDLQLVEKAFSSFANELEHALAQYLVTVTRQELEETSIIDKLSSLKIDVRQSNFSVETHQASADMGQKRHFSSQKQPVVTVAASLSQRTTFSVCFNCKQPGHFKDRCPQIRCYRCTQYGHYGKNCPQLASTPEKKRIR